MRGNYALDLFETARGAGEPAALPDKSLGQGGYLDYIDRCHNPRQRRRLELQQQLLTQPSVNMETLLWLSRFGSIPL